MHHLVTGNHYVAVANSERQILFFVHWCDTVWSWSGMAGRMNHQYMTNLRYKG